MNNKLNGREVWRGILVQGSQYNYYHGVDGKRDGVGIVMCEQLEYRLLTVERKCDILTRLALDQIGEVWTLVSCFAPQTGCTDQEKDEFCDKMYVPRSEIVVVAGDVNGHVGKDRAEYKDVN